jgi:hypothetical protein
MNSVSAFAIGTFLVFCLMIIVIVTGMKYGEPTVIDRPSDNSTNCMPGYVYNHEQKQCISPAISTTVRSVRAGCFIPRLGNTSYVSGPNLGNDSTLPTKDYPRLCRAQRGHNSYKTWNDCKSDEKTFERKGYISTCIPKCKPGYTEDPNNMKYCIGPKPTSRAEKIGFNCSEKDTFQLLRGQRCFDTCPTGTAFSGHSAGVGTCTRPSHEIDHQPCETSTEYLNDRCYSKCPPFYNIKGNRCVDDRKKTRIVNYVKKTIEKIENRQLYGVDDMKKTRIVNYVKKTIEKIKNRQLYGVDTAPMPKNEFSLII